MAGSLVYDLLQIPLLMVFSESASLNIEAVCMTAEYCIGPFLRRDSFSDDMAITAKARSHGRNTAE